MYVTHQVLVAAVHERAGYARGVERRAVFTDQPILHERGFLLERRVPDDHAVVVAPEREVHALGSQGERAAAAAVACASASAAARRWGRDTRNMVCAGKNT